MKHNPSKKRSQGFTLLEMMLVLAIIGGILVMAINYGSRQIAQQRRDKTAIQMQQILDAGLAYYTSYGTWPGGACSFASTSSSNSSAWKALTSLSGAGFLPSNLSANGFGYGFQINCDSVTGEVFYVVTQTASRANALTVAGEVPVGYASDKFGNPSTTGAYVTAQVPIPGQNLNNARSVNFSGIYHHGACVPVPSCPGYSPSTNACTSGTNCMKPQIMVAPVSVSGVNITGSTSTYPISSFTAYAYGPASSPKDCPTGTTATACTITAATGIASPSGVYWRVCLQVITTDGSVATTNTGTGTSAWGQYASLMAITRCVPPNEPYGQNFTVYTN